ncbi:hypothetical protein [Holospora undulata]|uniref:Transposase n=1 Tax=Holospora undulata HU1 TaxID=1321371 RepID=A0A061JIP8_9PROT|nr:hypothetical protein [Holospora undulata]ETZ05513.1 hypothetical protein K737_300045 [Holospora undulata HU1]
MKQVLGAEFLRKRCKKYPKLKGVCADAGYRKPMEAFVRTLLNKLQQSQSVYLKDNYNSSFHDPIKKDS